MLRAMGTVGRLGYGSDTVSDTVRSAIARGERVWRMVAGRTVGHVEAGVTVVEGRNAGAGE